MLHLLQYYQNDFTFSPSLYSVALCDNVGLVLLILRLAMLFCHSSYCTMCIIHPDLVSFTFYTIPISPLCNLKNFSFTCIYIFGVSLSEPHRGTHSCCAVCIMIIILYIRPSPYRIFLNVSTRFFFTVTSRHFTGHTVNAGFTRQSPVKLIMVT